MDAELACFLRITLPEHMRQEAVEQVGITDIKFLHLLNVEYNHIILIGC